MMQLILEVEPSGVTDTMSMDVDTPVNGAITEIISEINQANKENKIMKNDIIVEANNKETHINKSTELEKITDEILTSNIITRVSEDNHLLDNDMNVVHEKEMENNLNGKGIEEMDVDMEINNVVSSENCNPTGEPVGFTVDTGELDKDDKSHKLTTVVDEDSGSQKLSEEQAPISPVTGTEENIKAVLGDPCNASIENTTKAKKDTNIDINMQTNLEDIQTISSSEDVRSTLVDEDTIVKENDKQSNVTSQVMEQINSNVESRLERAVINEIQDSLNHNIGPINSKESDALENTCTEENKANTAMTDVNQTSNNEDIIESVLAEHDKKGPFTVDTVLNKSSDLNYDDPGNTAENDNNGDKSFLTNDQEIKEPIDTTVETDPNIDEKLPENLNVQKQVLETENKVGSEINNKSAAAEISHHEDTSSTSLMFEKSNLINDSMEKESEYKKSETTIVTINEEEKIDDNSSMSVSEVSGMVEKVCVKETVMDSSRSASQVNVPQSTHAKCELEGDVNNLEKRSSEPINLGNNILNNNSQTDCTDDKKLGADSDENVEIIDDDIKIIDDSDINKTQEKPEEKPVEKTLPVVCKLSNTLDILSDDEEEASKVDNKRNDALEKQCIDIDDDDDIMLIEDDSANSKEPPESDKEMESKSDEKAETPSLNTDLETGEKQPTSMDVTTTSSDDMPTDISDSKKIEDKADSMEEKTVENHEKPEEKNMEPLLPEKFLKTAKKNLGEMTRDELEDFCVMKIVESLVDRSGLGEIKNKMKVMARNLEEYRKKALLLTKQNRDLQVVLKSVQEEQKKRLNVLIQPLKITRSVGMQVLMTDKPNPRRQGPIPCQTGRPIRSTVQQNTQNKIANNNNKSTPIPFPRLVPATNTTNKSPVNSPAKAVSSNGVRIPSPATIPKVPEKRPQTRMQSSSSVTVDLTDDEPPTKIKPKGSPQPPVRLVPPQTLMAQKIQNNMNTNSPRKVYIPISGPQQNTIRPGQSLMIKPVPPNVPTGPRPKVPAGANVRTQASSFKVHDSKFRHPAPLPEAVKQYTPATWKPLPPAPDLKLSKVENGIVISWKIDGIPESAYETVASYQLYAYQETSAPPSTGLWKKIGDVKALPLPMACTLTQFMAGFKYYFAVRAVDIRSRLGPFSVPGSILLLSKV